MFTIQRNALKAVSRFAGVKDIRYYLNGVRVQASPAETRLVATDGHTLAVHQWKNDNNVGYCDIIIPNDAIKAALAIKGAGCFMLDGGPDNWTLTACGQSIGFARIDCDRPVDYQRVIPSRLSGEVAQFNPIYLKRCLDAAMDLGNKGGLISVGYNGNSSALIDIGEPSMCVVLMPWRASVPDAESTAWVREPVAVEPVPLKAVA